MFASTALVYPCVLALLCVGAGLAVDRASGGWLPGVLLPAVGAAALIGVSQLTTYIVPLASATPYALGLVALAGLALGRRRLGAFASGWKEGRRERGWRLAVGPLAYAIALAPVLAAGRPTFSSFQALADSAVHMIGADYLIRHGQEYAHLDLHNSYGQYIADYYGSSYPSGADTLFGGSAFLLGLPLIWALQPFSAFMLATAGGPAWVLARRMRLAGGWAALAALTATVPALVYGYQLVASIKEMVALPMMLTLGALVALHARWLWRRTGVLPLAIVLAAGLSALGAGFGAWGLAAVAVLGAVAIGDVMRGRRSGRALLALIALGGAVTVLAALGTFTDLAGSLRVARAIASTGNPGNLETPLKPVQALGTWLSASYQHAPAGALGTLSYAIAALTLIAAALGAARVLRLGERALAGWIGLTVAAEIGLIAYATTWVDAKTIMLSSPALMLLAWSGIAGLRAGALRAAGLLAAVAVAGGVGVSDAMQYHSSNLAPTARYEELASIEKRYAGKGPALFLGFDEYALYVLRDMDVGGLEFSYPPVGLRLTSKHGAPVDLNHVPPAAFDAYPLIVTRRDPTVSEPPSAYRLEWQGTYYQVWVRRLDDPPAIAHLGLASTRVVPCASVRRLAEIAAAHTAGSHRAVLIAATPPEVVMVDVAGGRHPAWRYTHPGLVMSGAGRLETTFALPRAGVWDLWLKGELMPTVKVSVDGRALGSIGGEVDGNPHNPGTTAPLPVRLSGGAHRLTIARGGGDLAPGDGGWAIVHEIFLTPADAPDVDRLTAVAPSQWRTLCGGRYDWIEVVRG